MSVLRVFNPEHDLALAFGGTNYTPPPMARMLRRDLQLLPLWIASPGDVILSQDYDVDKDWVSCVNTQYNIGAEVVSINKVGEFESVEPWGWDRYVARRLYLDGVSANKLPNDKYLEDVRRLSHRRISITIHNEFNRRFHGLEDNTPTEIDSLETVREFARRHPRAYVKAPWSSSGKGVYRALDIEALDFNRWCSGVLNRQGSVLCEKPLDGVMDFAMEFKCVGGKSDFVGYSIFSNDNHCSFSVGLIASTQLLEDRIIEVFGDRGLLYDVRNVVIDILDKLISPFYSGYVGVDMLIYKDSDGEVRLNPCIELNLRTTMGVVTSIIGNNILETGTIGTFHVEFHKSVIPSDYRNKKEMENPIEFSSNGKLKSGIQFLTPIYKNSQYCSYIKVN